MYVDPSGEFFIFGTLLITTLIGTLVGFGASVTTQLYDNNWNWNYIDWKEAGVGALTGAATGLAFGLGASAGAIIAGKVAIGSLTVTQSLFVLGSTAITTNFIAGIGAYAIRYGINENNIDKMIFSGLGQAGKGIVSFGFGMFFAGTGNWGSMKEFSKIFSRTTVRYVLSYIPNYYFEETFMSLN